MAKSIRPKETDTFIDAGAIFDFNSNQTQEKINKLINQFKFDLRESNRKPLIFSVPANVTNSTKITFSCGGKPYAEIVGIIFSRKSIIAVRADCKATGVYTSFEKSDLIGINRWVLSCNESTFSVQIDPWEDCCGILFNHAGEPPTMSVVRL